MRDTNNKLQSSFRSLVLGGGVLCKVLVVVRIVNGSVGVAGCELAGAILTILVVVSAADAVEVRRLVDESPRARIGAGGRGRPEDLAEVDGGVTAEYE